jgi:hypothetical protein
MKNWLEAKKPTNQLMSLAALLQGQTAFSQATSPYHGLSQLLQPPPRS